VRDLAHRIVPQHRRKRLHGTAVTAPDDIIPHESDGQEAEPEFHGRRESAEWGLHRWCTGAEVEGRDCWRLQQQQKHQP
jgi:hypothetical protein